MASHRWSGSSGRSSRAARSPGSPTGSSSSGSSTGRDAAGEAAFAALVRRHGPMVLGVCRQLLGDHHHAEDAFQAVFLVLARKARSIRDPDLLGNWLYGVALRTARKASGRLGRRRKNEEDGSTRSPGCLGSANGRPISRSLDREQAEALHDEIDRLPVAFRLPVVLCYFEGLTLDEAARRLRWPAGTVRSRLARARDKLRRGLTRRGVACSTQPSWRPCSPRSASASDLIPPVRHHDPGRDQFRGRTGRRRCRLDLGHSPCPGGAKIHAAPQAETHRVNPDVPRCHRRRRGPSDSLSGDER